VLEPKVLDLTELVRGVERMLERFVGEDVSVEFNLNPQTGRVRADPGQLEQVIMNLVVNARDALDRGGVITLETSKIVLDDDYVALHADARPGPHVVLSVSDTGVGISPEIQGRIFEPFFTTKEPGRGTGLGLSTVYGIVRQSGGHIGVYSEPGEGTIFRIYLPEVSGETGAADAERPTVEFTGGSETILVVEDDAAVRRVTVRILKRAGYLVLEAESGRQALNFVTGTIAGVDLLITDVVMPEMGGPELGTRLASLWPGLKILYVSGYTDSTIARHGLGEGEAFLQKPFTTEALATKVRSLLA
jgi:CheY-like chemotaxis protein